jgi:hypothetical protein
MTDDTAMIPSAIPAQAYEMLACALQERRFLFSLEA